MENNTTLGYQGIVKLSLKIGDKVIEVTNHNSGTPELMKSICKFLTGNGTSTDTPRFLDLKRSLAEGTPEWETYLTQQITTGTDGRYYEYNTDVANWVAKFTFTIPYSVLVDYIQADDTAHIYRFYLYREEQDGTRVDLAYLPVLATDLARITPGIRAIIEWTLEIKNITA